MKTDFGGSYFTGCAAAERRNKAKRDLPDVCQVLTTDTHEEEQVYLQLARFRITD